MEYKTKVSTHHILMGVHEHIKLILLCYAENFDGEGNPLVIILPRTRMLDSFPSEDISNCVISPFTKSFEVHMGILEGKGTSNKRNIVTFEELVGNKRGKIR
jgi:hypothetical protein